MRRRTRAGYVRWRWTIRARLPTGKKVGEEAASLSYQLMTGGHQFVVPFYRFALHCGGNPVPTKAQEAFDDCGHLLNPAEQVEVVCRRIGPFLQTSADQGQRFGRIFAGGK